MTSVYMDLADDWNGPDFRNDVTTKYSFVCWGVQNTNPDDINPLSVLWNYAE
jgi:hypothetical protein